MPRYDAMFEPWVDEEMTLLELGIHRGGSLKLWRDYFRRGKIVGVDIKIPEGHTPADRVLTFEGSQTDRTFLSQVANAGAPQGFDIIIDDASHIGEWTKTAFWHLFDNDLKPGGMYVIEDWLPATGVTGPTARNSTWTSTWRRDHRFSCGVRTTDSGRGS